MKVSSSAPVVALDDDEGEIFIFRRLLAKAKIDRPFFPLLSSDAFMAWLPTVFAPERKTSRPLICFLDLKMPGATGFDVLRWIRQDEVFDSLPVAVFTSSDDPSDLIRAAKLGAECCVRKYPSTTELAQIVNDAEKYADGRDKCIFDKGYNLLAPRRSSLEKR